MRWLYLLFITLVACKENASDPGRYAVGVIEATSKSIEMPKLLKTELEKRYIEAFKKSFPKDVRNPEEILQNVPRDFLDVELSIWQSREGTLRENHKYSLLRGGGEIDLARIITGNKGSIYLKFKVNRSGFESESLSEFRTYFYSTSNPKIIDDDKYGTPCGSLVDITEKVLSALKDEPIRANVTDNRHVPALTGTYYFVHFAGEIIYLAAVSISDSRFAKEKCN